MRNDWEVEFEEIKETIRNLTSKNIELKKENAELKAERDFLRQALDQPGGRG